jgi:hypothetical protein
MKMMALANRCADAQLNENELYVEYTIGVAGANPTRACMMNFELRAGEQN